MKSLVIAGNETKNAADGERRRIHAFEPLMTTDRRLLILTTDYADAHGSGSEYSSPMDAAFFPDIADVLGRHIRGK
jgi:hypothetical protein